jgi:hypothetical protein
MIDVWAVVDFAGRWSGVTLHVPASDVAANTPAGFSVVRGDPRTLLESGSILPPLAPPPTDSIESWEWEPSVLRYRPIVSAAGIAREVRANTLNRIFELERASARPLRELLVNPTDLDARKKLIQLDQEIAELRRRLPD